MPWVRIDDSAMTNLKIVRLPDSALRLWLKGLCFCQMHLTDGLIPREALGPMEAKRKDIDALCTSKVEGRAPIWDRIEGVGFKVHDYLDYNDSREVVLRRRAEDNARKRKKPAGFHVESVPDSDTDSERIPSGVPSGFRSPESPFCSVDLVRKEEEKPSNIRSGGALAGSLHRDHLGHAACDPTFSRCVPQAVHAKLVDRLSSKHNGDRIAAGDELKRWYPKVWTSLPQSFVMQADAFKFWTARFDAEFASADTVSSGPKRHEQRSNVPDADETRRRAEARRNIQ